MPTTSLIPSPMIGAGDVSNAEHAFLNSVTSNVQTQISAAGGNLEFVETNAITAVTAIRANASVAWVTGYDYIVTLEAFAPTDNVEVLWMRFSDDNSTFEAGAADYSWGKVQNHFQVFLDTSDAQIDASGGTVGNDATQFATMEFIFINPMGTSEQTTCFWNGYYKDGSENVALGGGGGHFIQGNDNVQAVQFLWSGGSTFKAQGDIIVRRRKRS